MTRKFGRLFGDRFDDSESFALALVPDGIKLTWEVMDSETFYSLYRKSEADRKSYLIAIVNSLEYLDKTATYGLDYTYEVITNTDFSCGEETITNTEGMEMYYKLLPRIWRYLDGL